MGPSLNSDGTQEIVRVAAMLLEASMGPSMNSDGTNGRSSSAHSKIGVWRAKTRFVYGPLLVRRR